jgi:lycopene cyclase domain-containing protein
MKRFYYLISLVFFLGIPGAIQGYLVWHQIPILNFLVFIFFISAVGSVWDVWATRHGKKDTVWLWQFHKNNTLGFTIFGMPVEEYLFYIASSSYIIFIWEGIRLALAGKGSGIWLAIPLLGTISFIAIIIPYFIRPKGDRLL